MKHERKVVTRGARPGLNTPIVEIPSTESARAVVPGSLDDMQGGERPPELVFLATVRIRDTNRIDGGPEEGYIVDLNSVFGPNGTCVTVSGMFNDPDDALDAVNRLMAGACREAEEYGIDGTLPKG